MDECIVDNWNSVIKDGDIVYHLGDIYFNASGGYISSLLARLKGRKRLILGNHDNAKDQNLTRVFQKIQMWRMFPEFGVLLSHVPLHPDSIPTKKEGKLLNVHGHIHDKQSPDGPYHCVCVEQINYTPVNIEELRIK
jgi:calcineurin-like phosphoesterase family protein